MEILKNQPIAFFEANDRNVIFPIPYESGDPFKFQLKTQDVYTAYSNWAEDGDFGSNTGWQNLGTGLTISGGKLSGTVTVEGETRNSYFLKANRHYRLVLEITQNTGTITCFGKTAKGTGTFTIYHHPTNNPQAAFTCALGGTYEITEFKIEDVSDNFEYIAYVLNNSGGYEGTLSEVAYSGQNLIYDLNLGGFGLNNDEQYYIAIADPLANDDAQNFLPNGTFTNKYEEEDWTWVESVTAGNSFQTDLNTVDKVHEIVWSGGAAFLATDSLEQYNLLSSNTEYTVTFNITTITNAELVIHVGDASQSGYTSTGSYSITLDSGSSQTFGIDFKMTGGGAGAIEANSFTITKTNGADLVADYLTNNFHFRSSGGWSCDTKEIRALCNLSNLGFEFTDQESIFYLRIFAELKDAEYEGDIDELIDSAGTASHYYYRGRKSKKLVTRLYPEFVHDFLSTLGGYDNVYINQTEYVAQSSTYRFSEALLGIGVGELEVFERTQKSFSDRMTLNNPGIDFNNLGSNIIDPSNNNIVDPSGIYIIAP